MLTDVKYINPNFDSKTKQVKLSILKTDVFLT